MSVLVVYRTNDGTRTALLVGEGRKYLRVVTMDYPMRVRKVPLSEGKHMRVMDTPIRKALKVYKRLAIRDHKWWMSVPAGLKTALAV